MASTTVGIKVDEQTRERIRALAAMKDRSPHWLMREALAEYLDREEAREMECLEDAERWERYLLTGEGISHERARAWLVALADGESPPCPR